MRAEKVICEIELDKLNTSIFPKKSESLSIKYFQELLKGKIEVIEGFKKNYQFECVFSVAIKTEDAGTRFDLNELELSFIARISSRYGCTFITRKIEG